MASPALLEALPQDLIKPGQEEMLTPWFFEVDWERFEHESAQLPNTQAGQVVLDNLKPAASVEDAVLDDYIEYPMASRTINNDAERTDYLQNTWLPQEFTHGTVNHAVLDWGAGLEISARDARNKAARKLITPGQSIGYKLTKKVIIPTLPETMATVVTVKGLANESGPEFLYMRLSSICSELGLVTLAAVFGQMKKEEGVHRGNYYQDAAKRLEDQPAIQKATKRVMASHARVVGHERMQHDEIINLANLFDRNNPDHHKFVKTRDDRFEKLPGLTGIRPLTASFNNYRPSLIT